MESTPGTRQTEQRSDGWQLRDEKPCRTGQAAGEAAETSKESAQSRTSGTQADNTVKAGQPAEQHKKAQNANANSQSPTTNRRPRPLHQPEQPRIHHTTYAVVPKSTTNTPACGCDSDCGFIACCTCVRDKQRRTKGRLSRGAAAGVSDVLQAVGSGPAASEASTRRRQKVEKDALDERATVRERANGQAQTTSRSTTGGANLDSRHGLRVQIPAGAGHRRRVAPAASTRNRETHRERDEDGLINQMLPSTGLCRVESVPCHGSTQVASCMLNQASW